MYFRRVCFNLSLSLGSFLPKSSLCYQEVTTEPTAAVYFTPYSSRRLGIARLLPPTTLPSNMARTKKAAGRKGKQVTNALFPPSPATTH